MADPAAHGSSDPRPTSSQTAHAVPDPPNWDRLEGILNELPPGIPILPREDAKDFSKYRYKPPMMPTADAWKVCSSAMEKYDAELCKAYREEIDTLLVFAGLFSAVVTGFTVESYQWLQDDPSDAMVILLAQIAQSAGPNATAAIPPSSSGIGRSVSARINAYWFFSLALSLSTALVAILGKQWVREFERGAAGMKPVDVVGIRQLKFEGLEYWKVGGIISALPMLLQLSLALFALGILELLWHLHVGVAVTVCVPTATALLFYSATTFLPVLQYSRRSKNSSPRPQCAYKSPQALLALSIYQIVANVWENLGLMLVHRVITQLWPSAKDDYPSYSSILSSGLRTSWSHWDAEFDNLDRRASTSPLRGSQLRGLDWLSSTMDEQIVQMAVWSCFWHEAHRQNQGLSERRCVLRDDFAAQKMLSNAEQWQCALIFLWRIEDTREAASEMLIHCLQSMDVSTAQFMLLLFSNFGSRDPQIVIALVRAGLSHCRRHLDEDIDGFMACTSDIVARIPDYDTSSALQWALVSLTAVALSPSRPRSMSFLRRIAIIDNSQTIWGNALKMLSRSPEDFINHPRRLHHLPHVAALAALLRAIYELNHGPWTGPIPMPDDMLDYTETLTWDYHPEWVQMVMELFKISVRGVDGATSEAPSQPRNGSRDLLAHAALPPPDALPLAGTAETAAAEIVDAEMAPSSDVAPTASRRSHDGMPSTTKMPRVGDISDGQHARESPLHGDVELGIETPSTWTLEIVVVPGGLDHARASDALMRSEITGRGPFDAAASGHIAESGPAPALSEQPRCDSAGIRNVGGGAVVQVAGEPSRASELTPQPPGGRTPAPLSGGNAAEDPSHAAGDASAREITHTGGAERQHHAQPEDQQRAELPDAVMTASRAIVPSLQASSSVAGEEDGGMDVPLSTDAGSVGLHAARLVIHARPGDAETPSGMTRKLRGRARMERREGRPTGWPRSFQRPLARRERLAGTRAA